jgi:hypothetical protein
MDWHRQLIEDDTDPSTPLFWETVHWLATQGADIKPPSLELSPAPLGVQILELKRSVALSTPTQLMPVVVAE